MRAIRLLGRFLLRGAAATAVFAALVVVTQDLQVYPGAAMSLFEGTTRDPGSLPRGMEGTFFETADGERLEMWTAKPEIFGGTSSEWHALLFHGNADTLVSQSGLLEWLAGQGITSHGFTFRGFGLSSGWPSERGVEKDVEAAYRFVIERKKADPRRLVFFASSFGTGPATYLAQTAQPPVLVLSAPYLSIPDVVGSMPGLKYLRRFLWTELPSKRYLPKITRSCIIIVHGQQDEVIPFEHSLDLEKLHRGSAPLTLLSPTTGRHNTTLGLVQDEVVEHLERCKSWAELLKSPA